MEEKAKGALRKLYNIGDNDPEKRSNAENDFKSEMKILFFSSYTNLIENDTKDDKWMQWWTQIVIDFVEQDAYVFENCKSNAISNDYPELDAKFIQEVFEDIYNQTFNHTIIWMMAEEITFDDKITILQKHFKPGHVVSKESEVLLCSEYEKAIKLLFREQKESIFTAPGNIQKLQDTVQKNYEWTLQMHNSLHDYCGQLHDEISELQTNVTKIESKTENRVDDYLSQLAKTNNTSISRIFENFAQQILINDTFISQISEKIADKTVKRDQLQELIEKMKTAWIQYEKEFWVKGDHDVTVYSFNKETNKAIFETEKKKMKDENDKPTKDFHYYKIQLLSKWVNNYWTNSLNSVWAPNEKEKKETNQNFVNYLIQKKSRWCFRFIFNKQVKPEGDLKDHLDQKRLQYRESDTNQFEPSWWSVPKDLFKIYHISQKDGFSVWRLTNAWHTAIKENQSKSFKINKQDGTQIEIGPIVYGDNLESVTSYHLSFD